MMDIDGEMVVSRCGLETRPRTRIEPLFSLLMGPTVVVVAVGDGGHVRLWTHVEN